MTTTIEYALMAGHAYRTTRDEINQLPVPLGWTPFFPVPDSTTLTFPTTAGFEAVAFQKGTDIVISYAGTNSADVSGDIAANIGLATGFGSAQLLQAAEYYLQVQAANPTVNVTFTGHSLGGGLAALMGVFFGKQAVTFNQAPFAKSAELSLLHPDVAANLKSALVAKTDSSGNRLYSDDALSGLTGFLQLREATGGIPNSSLVTSINVQGEFLSGVPWNVLDRIGTPADIPDSATGVSGTDLHSQALLTVFLQSVQTAAAQHALNDVTYKLTDLMGMIFASSLFAHTTDATNTTDQNFLERLVQHEAGDAIVTRFTADLWRLAQDGGLTIADDPAAATQFVSKALTAFAMQMYYENTANATNVNKELFTEVTGGVQFDRADVAATLGQAKGYNLYFQEYLLNTFSNSERQLIQSVLPMLRDWYVQAGLGGMTATDAHNRGAFMLGGNGADTLTGGSQTDLLVGNAGMDTLDGGSGSDRMVGGDDDDTYYVDAAGDQVIEVAGGGVDTIISSAPSFVLAEHVEQLTVTSGGVLGQGNALDNELGATTFGSILSGGQGHDRYVVTVDKTQVVEVAGEGTDTVESTVSVTLGANIETLILSGQSAIDGTGNDQDNTLIGNSAGNVLLGGGGQDHLLGSAGTDTLSGGAGTDLLEGGADADVYLYHTGDGLDQIEDTEGLNLIVYDGQLLQGGLRRSEDAPNTYTSLDGRFTYVQTGGDLLVNGTLVLNTDFQDGQFGIQLVDEVDYANGLPTRTNADYVSPPPSRTPIFDDNGQALVLAFDPTNPNSPASSFNVAIHALGGNDVVSAFGQGNDQLFGDDGDDWLIGSGGDDRLFGGEGNDQLDGDSVELSNSTPGRDRLEGGAGNDVLFGKQRADILLGGTGDDTLFGDGGNELTWDASGDEQDMLDGGEGTDILYGGGGDDVLTGGADNDSLWGDYGEIAFDAIGGTDTLDGGTGHDGLVGGGGADMLFGGDGNDLLIGDSPIVGNRVLGANDTLSGGDGNDDLIGQGGDDVLLGGAGDDSLWGDNQGNFFLGTTNDSLDGGPGNDHLYGEKGRDILEGGTDNDDLQGGDDDDQLTGGAGSDALLGDDTAINRALALSAAPGVDMLDGGEGNDILSGSGGNDHVVGGSGTDILFGDDWSFDPIVLGPVDNPFVGAPVRIVFGSAPGHDTLDGGEGSDVLFGGAGDDTLVGGVGTDYLFGDLGPFSDAGGADTLDGGEGADHLDGGRGNDVLTAGAGGDFLAGGDGDDLLDGGDGDDTLLGGGGTNTLLGGAGDDQLFGDEGDDLFDAGEGDDVIRGGAGSDTYLFGRGSGRDLLSNQSFSGADTIRLAFDVAPSDVTVARAGSNLLLRIQGSTDQLTIENYFQGVFDQVAFVQFADGILWDGEWIKDQILSGAGADGKLQGFEDRNDTVKGTEGSQLLVGLGGDDTLDGGAGLDTLKGGGGSDTYRFTPGSGSDVLFDRAGDADTVQMGSGILPGDVAVLKSGTDLVLNLRDTMDSLVVSHFFVDPSFQIERVTFEDGTAWDLAMLQSLAQPVVAGTNGLDVSLNLSLSSTQANESTSDSGQDAALAFAGGVSGEAVMLTEEVSGILIGTDGQDVLVGGTGSDLLDGGAGNDGLYGFEGNDTYLFGVGSGQDVVLDYDPMAGNVDTIQLAPDITPSQITITRNGDDLVLGIAGTNDGLTLQSFLFDSAHQVEQVVFADGAAWDAEFVRDKARAVTRGTEGSDFLRAQGNGEGMFDDLVIGEGGNDVLTGDAGSSTGLSLEGQDKLLGGAGNDRLLGGGENDVLDGGVGDDRLYGDAIYSDVHFDNAGPSFSPGDDILLGGEGNDSLFGQRGDDVLEGGAGADVLNGDEGSDTILGGAGDDTLYGDALFSTVRGNDTLDGGEGNDTLSGGAGADTYVFGRGYSQDFIEDNDFTALPQINTIQFASDLTPSDLMVRRAVDPTRLETGHGDLVLALNGSADQLTLEGFLSGFNANFFRAQFADGTVWDAETLKATAGFTVLGTAAADRMLAYDSRDMLQGLGGNDNLSDNGLAATLAGGVGDDMYNVTVETARISEFADEGSDGVESSVDYILPDHVENLTLLETNEFVLLPDGRFGPNPERNPILGVGNVLDNVLIGNAGMNILSGGAGADTLYGSQGGGGGGEGGSQSTVDNDFLIGGAGNDTYLFTRGNGVDTIVDTDAPGEGNRILFGAGITQANLTFVRNQDTLAIALFAQGGGGDEDEGEGYYHEEDEYVGGGGGDGAPITSQDAIILQSFDPNRVNGSLVVETLEFADGSFINLADLFPPTGPVVTEGDDTLTFGLGDDVIDALGGNDTVDVDGGNDTVLGGAGNDTLLGGDGTDILDGGTGNDALDGGAGDDAYHYGLGAGLDQVTDTAGTDTVWFGAGISFDTTVVRLMEAAGITTAHLRLLDEFGNERINQGLDIQLSAGGTSPIEQFAFADGTARSLADLTIQTVVTEGTRRGDVIRTGRHDDIIYAGKGGDTIYAGSGHDTVFSGKDGDTIFGEAGHDTLYGEKGDDVLDGGYGNDWLEGHKGDDTLRGGSGDDALYGDKGKDMLQGGAGNDLLDSGDGDDTILFDRGDGKDTLIGEEHNEDDTVCFGADIDSLDLMLTRQADDLRVSIYGTTDQFTVRDWYTDRDNRVDEFITGNGQSLENSKVNQLIQAMAGFTAQTGLTWEQAIAQRPLDIQQILTASWK